MNVRLKSCIQCNSSSMALSVTIFTEQCKLTVSQMMDRNKHSFSSISQHHGAKPCDSRKRSRASAFEAGAGKAAQGCVGWDAPCSVDSEA